MRFRKVGLELNRLLIGAYGIAIFLLCLARRSEQ